MKRALLTVAAAGCLLASHVGLAAGLADRVAEHDGWAAWRVPMAADAGDPCCYEGLEGFHRRGCDLDGRNWSFGTDDAPRTRGAGGELAVYVRVEHGRIERVRALEASCPVKTSSEVRWIDGADQADSIRLLAARFDAGATSRKVDDDALAAIAFHAHADATRALAARAEPSHPRDAREQALFWLGQARGAEGADIVERYATTDADPELRSHAVFALSQSHSGDPYLRVRTIAGSDVSEEVRSQALFWMAQMGDARARADITAALATERSEKVREQAVFALSQLKDDEADDALLALLRGSYPREVKKQALFWLGQSGSPRAMQAIDDLLK